MATDPEPDPQPTADPTPTPLFQASLPAVVINYCCAAALLLLGFQFYTTAPVLLEPAWAGAVERIKGHWPEANIPLYQNTFAAPNATPTLYFALIAYLVALPLY